MSIAAVYPDPDAAALVALIRRTRRRHDSRSPREALAITAAAIRQWARRQHAKRPQRLAR
jgi:hypothetical protein